MVLLFCAVVGVVGDAFSVKIDEAKDVYNLSKAVRTAKANELKDVGAWQLELYLAKKDKGHGAWLTEEEAADVRYESVPQEFKPMRTTGCLNDSEYFGENFQPGEGHVHVLVLYPTDLHISMNDQYPEVIASYMEVADRLKETEEVKALSTHLANISVKNDAFTPFVVLENSSGMGKTQMAFNLQANGECEVFYFKCGRFGLGAQRVYRAYEKRSTAFQYCLENDLKAMETMKFGHGEPIGSVGDIRRSTTLALYSFILAALRGRDVVIGTASRSDVYAEVARRKERGAKPFVFFLDEFPRARHIKSCFDDDEKVNSGEYQMKLENALRMTRNVFLSFGLTVVACSTNGSGKNLFVTSSRSQGGEPSLWCVVFPSLPRVNIVIDPAIPVLLKEIIKHSRPLFAEIALKHVQDHPYNGSIDVRNYLDGMAGALASGFRMLKRQDREFKIGQLCLLLCSSCHVQDTKVDIIDSHFARLPEQSAFKLYLSVNGLIKDNDFWTCRAVPPSPSEDLLLHLTMMGGLFSRPFKKPMCRVMSKIQAPFYYDKSDQRSSEGIRLEELTTASIVLASHAGGFGGVAFPAFLGELLYELGVNEQGTMVQLQQDVENAGWTRIVPFLSPPTAEWPEWMNDNSMHFGNLVRTRTYDRIELRARSNFISGENEEKNSAVDAGVMKSILMCVPDEPMVHLVLMDTLRKRHVTGEVAAEPRIHVVVTNSIQTGCFPDGFSWETFVREQSLQNVDFYRISEGSTLQEIEGMTNRSKTEVVANKKLVLFIELGKK